MNRKTFTEFYQENVKRIYRYVYFRVGKHREIAEDLTAEIFTKALEHFDAYDENLSRSAWIYTIARNRVMNYWRDRKEIVDIEDGAIAGDVPSKDPRGELHHALDLERMLAELTEEERELVTLKYLSGYRYARIAEMVGKSSDAVKVATHRALQKVKKVWSSRA